MKYYSYIFIIRYINGSASTTLKKRHPNVSGMTLLITGGSGNVDISNYKYIAIILSDGTLWEVLTAL